QELIPESSSDKRSRVMPSSVETPPEDLGPQHRDRFAAQDEAGERLLSPPQRRIASLAVADGHELRQLLQRQRTMLHLHTGGLLEGDHQRVTRSCGLARDTERAVGVDQGNAALA